MSDADANPRRRRWLVALFAATTFILLLVAGLVYVSGPRFSGLIRDQFIASLQRATGGEVRVASFLFRPWRLGIEVDNLSIRRPEVYGRAAYIHVDGVQAQLKWSSLLHRQLALSSLRLERPRFELATAAAGAGSGAAGVGGGSSIEELFRITTDRLVVEHGELQFNDRRIPLDFTAYDVSASATHFQSPERYVGHLTAGKIDTSFEHWRPFASTAEVDFTLRADRLEFQSVQRAGPSRLVARGEVRDFSNPRIDLTYDSTLDLAQARAVARSPMRVGGALETHGTASYTREGYETSGELRINGGSYNGPEMRVRDLQATSSYKIDNDVLTLSGLRANVLGGTATGDIRVVAWNVLATAGAQRGTAKLRLQRISLAQLADAMSNRKWPLDKLRLAGAAAGAVEAKWSGSPQEAEARLDIRSIAPGRVPAGALPVSGQFRGIYHGRARTLDIAALVLDTSATHLTAGGTIGSRATSVQFAATSRGLEEFQPALARLHLEKQIPVQVHGRASFQGIASGNTADPVVTGHLHMENFETHLVPVSAGTPGAPRGMRQLHWDSLDADVQLSSRAVSARNAVLTRGTAEVQFAARAGLDHYTISNTIPITVQAHGRNAAMQDVQSLAGTTYPVSGTLSFSVQAQGTPANLGGTGRVELTRARLYGEPFEEVTSDIRFAGSQAEFNKVQLVHRQATIKGSLAYDLKTTQFRFQASSTNLDLARVQRIQSSRLPIAGQLSFTAEGEGTRANPRLAAHLMLRELVLSGEHEGRFLADAVTEGHDLKVTGRSQFEHADLQVDGVIRMTHELPAQVQLRFSRLDVDPLLHAYLRGHITGHSSTQGTVQVSGPLLHPRRLNGRIELDQFSAELENVRIASDGPIRAAMTDRLLSIQSLRLVGEGTDIAASGTAQLIDPWQLNLRADGLINLKVVQSLNPDYTSSGMVNVGLRVGGTMWSPDMEGELQVTQGAISYIDLPSGLSDINGTLAFNRDRLNVRALTAKTGGGTLNLGGYVTYGRKINFDVTARGQEVRLRYPPGVSSTANLDLHLAGSLASSVLSGNVLITRFGLNPDFDFAVYLARTKQGTPLTPADSPLTNLKLDVHVTSTPELQVQTSSAKLSGDVDLRLRGTGSHPAVLGRVNITQGQVSFNGTKYELERGDITFTNPVSIEPVFDLEAMARVRDYDITLGFHGPIDKLSTTYSSDPPLPTSDIIALLAVGRTREESAMLQSQNTENFAQSTSNAILGQALNQAESNRLERLFGVSRIKIDPEAGGAENNTTGTRVTVEQQVANNVTLTYITNVSQAQQQIIQAEYYITKNLSIIAVRDQNGVLGVDVRIRRRKK